MLAYNFSKCHDDLAKLKPFEKLKHKSPSERFVRKPEALKQIAFKRVKHLKPVVNRWSRDCFVDETKETKL